MRSHSSCLFDTGQSLLVDLGLCAPTRLVFFDTGQPLLVDFGLCASTRFVFFTLVNRCWWTLAYALPLVFSFSHWSVTVGGLLLVRSHSSCLFFLTLVSRCWRTLACALPLVLSFSHWSAAVGGLWFVRFHSSFLCDTGQSLLVDFGLCAPTRLIFF